ncbi:hypothetical protein [Lignipirellula cremea]|uniref:Lactonase, 7-bladed beta-propeller n=1 Tax=Lignipirellula cremea TaxID=2528010 RepID=A0A518E3L9_9BACT|nr:hypothetical protein [Lignipirellula cremea]QDU98681.1 hypothetical protein Pla8534_65540 [Lignipirellula cremea]
MLTPGKLTAAIALLGACCSNAMAADAVLGKTTTGAPEIRSIQVLAFAPDGVLLVGDGAGSQIFAIATDDTSSRPALAKPIDGVDGLIGARLGTNAKGVEIVDLAVNPASQAVYMAVRKQDDKSYAILHVDGSGQLKELDLGDQTRYARLKLDGGSAPITSITDVAWADGRLVAAGRANDAFASKIFSVYGPLDNDQAGEVYSTESYHVSHRRWETKAPMSVLIPLQENGKSYVIGAFSCTPIVKYPLDSLSSGDTIKGQSVLELGSGNRPIDMFLYEKDGVSFVLSNTFRFHHEKRPFGPSPYWTVKFQQSVLSENDDINEQALQRLKGNDPATDKVELVEAYHGVMQMDQLNSTHAVVLREGDEGLSLAPLLLP